MKANEDQWAVRKKQIADDTQITIDTSRKAIAKATDSSKLELKNLQSRIETIRQRFNQEEKNHQTIVSEVERSIKGLEHNQKVLSHTNATLQDVNRNLNSEIVVHQDNVNTLKIAEESLSVNIAELHVQQQQIEDQLVSLRIEFEEKNKDFAQLQDTIEQKTKQFNTDISILDQKKQILVQEIIENHAQNNTIRENLASWNKKLDERDKNLRIREAKVNDQEKSIARNYNLLNL